MLERPAARGNSAQSDTDSFEIRIPSATMALVFISRNEETPRVASFCFFANAVSAFTRWAERERRNAAVPGNVEFDVTVFEREERPDERGRARTGPIKSTG